MASLKDLIVLGPARFLDKLYGNLEGNATTATKLQTPRTINGTNFDGSGNISTSYWGSERTLTIGNTGKSVDGSSNVAWSIAEIGALPHFIKSTGPDANSLTTTGYYSIRATGTNVPSEGHSIIFVDSTVGTPFQLYMHDATFTLYKRNYRSGEGWGNWTSTLDNSISGNAGSATRLQIARSINGTIFDGSTDITTSIWGSPRNFNISDSTNDNFGDSVSINGSTNITLKMPSTFKMTKTQSITVEGDANTYYPVVISMSTAKDRPMEISIHKNLGSPTPSSYENNHSNGTSSLWLLYEGRNGYWDGNGGFLKTLYKDQGYATLVSHAVLGAGPNGDLRVWLRGGGCYYEISTTVDVSVSVYYSETNIGTSEYPSHVAPRTDIGNGGLYTSTYYGYGAISGSASSVRDRTSGAEIYLNYGASGLSTASWFTAWNGYELRAISPINSRITMSALSATHANGYYGMGLPDGNTTSWIRTTSLGIIPYQSGGASALGTESWPFNNAYINTVYGNLSGNATTATRIQTAGTTAQFYRGDNTWSNIIKQTSSSQLGVGSDLKIGPARKDLNFDIANGSGSGINDGYAGGITWGSEGSAYAGIYYQTSGNYGSRLIFGTTNLYIDGVHARMIITSDGYVGIGTLSPSQKLAVEGNIYASSKVSSPVIEGTTRGQFGGTSTTSYALNTSSFICDSWIRSKGASGWYNEDYGGGWYMEDTTYVRAYNDKKVYVSNTSADAISTAGGVKALIGFSNVQSGVSWNVQNQNSSFTHYTTSASAGHWFNKAVYVQGNIYAGSFYSDLVLTTANYSGYLDSRYVNASGDTMSDTLYFSNTGATSGVFKGIRGVMADNDYWRVGGSQTGSNAGYLEIATGDDGTEPIYVRQYSGAFSSLIRTFTLLDGSGNTTAPGQINANSMYSTTGVYYGRRGSIPFLVPDYADFDYNSVDSSNTSGNDTYKKGAIKLLCQNNRGLSNVNVFGAYHPNSQGPLIGQIYHTSTIDSASGLPQYSTFLGCNLGGSIEIFGTVSYTYYHKTVLDSSNYTSYTVTKTGSGASGTWGINISGNADTLDGYHGSSNPTPNTYVLRDANNYIFTSYINSSTSNNENSTVGQIITTNGSDNYYRKVSLSHLRDSLYYSKAVVGSYTANGGQQNPNYFGMNRVGFLMMNTTVNSNSNYKDWLIMDCYAGNDVGGGIALGVNRQQLGAYIMGSDSGRTSWSRSAELYGTHNIIYSTTEPSAPCVGAIWLKPA